MDTSKRWMDFVERNKWFFEKLADDLEVHEKSKRVDQLS